MQQGKALIHSATFWIAVSQLIVAIIVAVQSYLGAYVPGDVLSALLGVKSILDIVMRLYTTQPVTSVLPNPNNQ